MKHKLWYLGAFCGLFILSSCSNSEESTTTYETDTSYVLEHSTGNPDVVRSTTVIVDSPETESDFERAGRKIDAGVDEAGNALDKTGKAIDRTAKKVGHDVEQGYKNTKADIDTAINAVKENKRNR